MENQAEADPKIALKKYYHWEFYLLMTLVYSNFLIPLSLYQWYLSTAFFTALKRSCGKVMFLHLSVNHSVHGGVSVWCHCLSSCQVPCSFWWHLGLFLCFGWGRVYLTKTPWTDSSLTETLLGQRLHQTENPLDRDPTSQRTFWTETPCTIKSRQYASYWKAFLLVLLLLYHP